MMPSRSGAASGSRWAVGGGQHIIRRRHGAARMGEDVDAGRRQAHRFADALEQVDAELSLELEDLSAEGGLAHRAGLGGTAEMSMLGDGDDVAEIAEVHGVPRIGRPVR